MSLIIWFISYSIVKHLSPDYIKVSKSPEGVEHSTSLFLETYGFPQCLGAIDVREEPGHHCTDYINRKGYTSINVQAVCNCKYSFMDIVAKWPDSVRRKNLIKGTVMQTEKALINDCLRFSKLS